MGPRTLREGGTSHTTFIVHICWPLNVIGSDISLTYHSFVIITPHRICVSITMGRIVTDVSVVGRSVGRSVGLE